MAPASELDQLADEAEELDGYFSDTPVDPQPDYPDLRTSYETSVVITNLPVIGKEKFDKLSNRIAKVASRIGTLVTDASTNFQGIYMPFDEAKNTTLGFCMVEYATVDDAEKAVNVLQGYSFDKKHQLAVTSYPKAQQLRKMTTVDFVAPTPEPFAEKPNAMEWLEDANQRDEFVIRFQQETVVNWFDHKSDPLVDYDGAREKEAGVSWCEYYCHWSPAGSYLATLVPAKGVILWSGKTYEKVGRFVAPYVKNIVFSPKENYLMTNNQDPDDPAAIKIYHVVSGNLLRTFPLFAEKDANRDAPPSPFLWSHDDKYLARMGKDLISIYETPSMKLLDSRSLPCDGISDFQWSPTANVLAYWAPEANNAPAHVDLLEIPSRKKIRQKNLFNVTKCNMVFSPSGDYLAVKVTRHTKSKKTLYNNIELFRLNQPGVPVEMLDIKDAVMALAWEPNGSRFAMIHAENPTASKVQVSLYNMMKKPEAPPSLGGTVGTKQNKKAPPQQRIPELNKIETLQGKQCNFLFWSPAGSTLLMASLGDSASGSLEFYDVDTKTLVVKEHYRANQVLWDPSGRSVATCVTQPMEGGHFKFAMDNGYVLWSFQGKQLYQQSFETFYEFEWRPRESLLNKKEIKKVRQNLKKYEKEFDKADRKRERARYLEETAGKRAERSRFRELLQRNRAILRRQREKHVTLLNGYDSDDDENYVVVDLTIEKVLSTKEEVVM